MLSGVAVLRSAAGVPVPTVRQLNKAYFQKVCEVRHASEGSAPSIGHEETERVVSGADTVVLLLTINSDSTREVSTAATRRATHQSCVTDLTSATNQFDLLAAIVHIGLAPTRLGRMCNRALKLSTHLDCVRVLSTIPTTRGRVVRQFSSLETCMETNSFRNRRLRARGACSSG